MKAVIPAAGWGIRFLPLTKEQPKEMIPVVDKPTIQYVVEEALAAGITDIVIITGRHKRGIEDHFDRSYELEAVLERGNKKEYLKKVRDISNMADIHFIRQKEQRGLGDAVLKAKQHIGDEPFAVMLGDTIYRSKVPVVKQLMDVHKRTGRSVIAIEPVPREKVKDYGIIAGRKVDEDLYLIDDLVEKPLPELAPSDLAIAGTYILTHEIFEAIERTPPGLNGEVQLTDALRLLRKKQEIYGWRFEGKRYDIGDMIGWLKTQVELGLLHPEYSAALKEHIESLLNKEKEIDK
ncbi:MAG: UTP--glucose-1-phosphate uridylyltransferase GalU [Methanomassiliicoccales archaeon]|nr:MAG: UTP--glucose-1-phosphate uridylyltransferase GalU [Methanomassiliicoccales archaeon]